MPVLYGPSSIVDLMQHLGTVYAPKHKEVTWVSENGQRPWDITSADGEKSLKQQGKLNHHQSWQRKIAGSYGQYGTAQSPWDN